MENENIYSKRIVWVDTAKFAAIFAVMVDHTAKILYNDLRIQRISFFSVGLFILLMGITAYHSFEKGKFSIRKKLCGILPPYITATVIYCLFSYQFFDLETVLKHIVFFNASGPLYYVLLYIQLVIISPIVYKTLKSAEQIRFHVVIECFLLVPILFISGWMTKNSNILSVYGGGGKLFGGSYLVLLYLGMWFAKYYPKINLKKNTNIIFFPVSLALFCGWGLIIGQYGFILDQNKFFSYGLNPPGFSLFLYAMLAAITFFLAGSLLNFYPESIPGRIFNAAAKLGQHTLYIFLYHKFIIDYILNPIMHPAYLILKHFTLIRILYFLMMIFGSILIEYMSRVLYTKIVSCYTAH